MKSTPDDNDVLRKLGPRALDPEADLVIAGGRIATAKVSRSDSASTPWSRAVSAQELLAGTDADIEWVAQGLAAPGSVTGIASPRGLGKSHLLHALAVAAATGGEFLGERLRPCRVLLLDRDNSRREVKRRLREWGQGRDLSNLKVLTRDDCPSLTDTKAWQEFPFSDYDLVILDSLGSATEGVEDNRGGDSSRALAPLLDLARKGPAVIVALNTPKNGLNYRGSGVIADRFDILYEVRDATDLKPDAKHDVWWASLAEGQGEAAWSTRAGRRRRRDDYRLALVSSKFRIGEEPDPRCVESNLAGEWSIQDVTAEVEAAHAAARGGKEEERVTTFQQAVESLAAVVAERYATGHPLTKTQAEEHLRGKGLTQKHARAAIERPPGERWRIDRFDRRAKALVPCESRSTTRSQDEERTLFPRGADERDSVALAAQGQRDSMASEPLSRKGHSDPGISSSREREPNDPFDDDWGEIEVEP